MSTKLSAHACDETVGTRSRPDTSGDMYWRCGAPARTLVQHRGRSEGPYWMCDEHADHNIKNRNAEDITPADERVDTFTVVKVGTMHHGYVINDRFMSQVYDLLSELEKQS